MAEAEHRVGVCNLCEAICGLEFTVQDNQILSIKGHAADPLSHGHICPKAVALKDIHEDPDRLRQPMIREGDQWREASWEEAFDKVAEALASIHAQYGADAIGAYFGNPNVHNYGSLTHAQHFLGPIKTRNRFSATSVDQLPHQLLAYWMYGHQLLVPIPDIDHTDYFLVLGANPMASNGSLMTVPDFRNRLKRLQKRGGRMVVLDPRRTETAAVADAHHFVRPGTDAAFLLAILRHWQQTDRIQPGRLAEFSEGLDEVLAVFEGLSVEALAAHCGIDAEAIRCIAEDFAAAESAVCYGRMGVSVQAHGTLCQWLIQLINLVSGNLDRPGGSLFTKPAVDLIEGPTSKPGHFNVWQSRVRGLPEFGGELPCSALAEEILTPGEGQIRALVTSAGNPVLSTPNGRQLDEALSSLEFMVSIDIYLNETTRHADVILPPTCAVEHDHYDLIFHVFAVHNTARYTGPIVQAPEGARHDWQIFNELGQRIAARLDKRPPPAIRPDQIIDMGLQAGPYGAMQKHPQALSLKKLQENPGGVDLGPLASSMPARLAHPDKRIRCHTPELFEALKRFLDELGAAEQGAQDTDALRLIGRRHVRSNNSWMHNFQRLVKGPSRHELLMNPQDMAARGLSDGQRVRLRSRVGAVEIECCGSEDMMPGVVSLPHGWGHDRAGVRLQVAQAHAGASNNDLTDPELLDISGNAALNGVPVQVEAA